MEHLVKRNPDFSLNISKRRKVKTGQSGRLTQSRIGADPFKLDKKGLPIDVKKGDVVWLMESRFGVYAKYKVDRVSSTEKITSLDALNQIRISFDFSFQMQNDFWTLEEQKLKKALAKNKALHFVAVSISGGEDIEDFPVKNKPGLQGSWIKLNEENKKYFFSLKGKETCEENIIKNSPKDYGNIPAKIKHLVAQIWKHKTVHGKPMFEVEFDLDHLIPKSVGGAGIFVENIVPLESSINRYKSNRIPISFAKVALRNKFKQINDEIVDNWDITTKSKKDLTFLKQKNLTQQILEQIKKWSAEKQRNFYFQVLCEEYGEVNIKNKYKKAGVPIP